MEIRGKTVLLTGATGGLGGRWPRLWRCAARRLILSSRRGPELESLAASLPGEGHTTLVCDLATDGAAERLVADSGRVDILVANAALPGSGRLEAFSHDQLERALRVNLEAPIKMAHDLIPAMRERGSGQLVFISSLSGKAAAPRTSMYSATKFGLRGFSLALREDLHGTGVGVSLVLPGFIRDAGMFADSKSKPPPLVGTSTPERVAAGLISAIERDRAEVQVAPIRLRLAVGFAHRMPRLAARLSRGSAQGMADGIARGQADKR